MRMAGPDIVLFVVGALLFAGATTAIVTTPGGLEAITGGNPSPLGLYDVSYSTRVFEGEPEAVSYGSPVTATAQVNQTHVGRVVVRVACSDPVPGGTFTLSISVEGPNGLASEPVSASCAGEVEVPVEVEPEPPATTVQGSTPEEARENLPAGTNATRAQGMWTITVSGARGAAPGGLPIPGQASPTGSIQVDVETWEPSFTPESR